MADDTVITPEVQANPELQAADANKAQLDQLMAANLNGWLPQDQRIQVPEQVANTNVPEGNSSTTNIPATVAEPATVPEFKFDTFKTEFGYEKPEDIVEALKQYRTLKETPPTPAEIKFENEKSKLLFDAIKSGKSAEVYSYLDEQHRLDRLTAMEVTKDSASEIIKAGFQLKYKGLSPEMVDHKFNKTFGLPSEPRIAEDEDKDDFDLRHNEWKSQVKDIEMERLIEANLIKPELEAAKAKLLLPEIPQTVDQDYLQWKQEQVDMDKVNAEVIEAYKGFKHEDVKYGVDFIDEANKINTKIEYVPSAEAFKKAQEMATDVQKFWDTFKNSDGSPNRKGFISFLARYVDEQSFIAQVITQAKNATIKASLPDNQSDRNQRQVANVGEKSELDKQMEAAGIRRN